MGVRDSRGITFEEQDERIAALVARKRAAGERLPGPVRIRQIPAATQSDPAGATSCR